MGKAVLLFIARPHSQVVRYQMCSETINTFCLSITVSQKNENGTFQPFRFDVWGYQRVGESESRLPASAEILAVTSLLSYGM